MFSNGMRVSLPFGGILAPIRAVESGKAGSCKLLPVNVIENKSQLCNYISQATNTPCTPSDVMDIDLRDIAESEWLIMGPPCQPHTRHGKNKGGLDERCAPFFKSILIAKALRLKGRLSVVVIEESPGIMDNKSSTDEPFIDVIDRMWAEHMPDWVPLSRHVLDGFWGGVAMKRNRVFLISVPKAFPRIGNSTEELPFVIPTHDLPLQQISDSLDTSTACLDANSVTSGMPESQRAYTREVSRRSHGNVTVSFADISRKPGGIYNLVCMMTNPQA